MTYKNCRKLIENASRMGTRTTEFIADMASKLDIFLLNHRLTEIEYNELYSMLNAE